MHAIRQYEFGPASTLRYEEVDDPHPGEGQVRITVAASGVHLIDTRIRSGSAGPVPLPALPMTPGRDVAGVIDDVGPGVGDEWLGRRVVAHLGQANGGYAELAVAGVAALHVLPDTLSDDIAVAMIGTGRTTMGILETARLTSEDVVLVTSAAGGIGGLLVQAARSVGAVVVGVAGGPVKVQKVRELGADVAVDYTDPNWADRVRASVGGKEITVALDGVGGAVGKAALDLLGAAGRLVLFGWSSGETMPLTTGDLYARGLSVTVALGPRLFRGLDELRALEERSLAAAATGDLTPLIGPVFSLAHAADAHATLETRGTYGKVILRP